MLAFSPGDLLALLLGYLFGSIPFGLILTRIAGTQDLRTIGSGNIGATNVLRTGRKDLALATLLFDALKGTLAVTFAAYFIGPQATLAGAAGAFFGHLYPVWLGFRGGKGVATYLGCLLGIAAPAALAFAAIWLALAWATRYSSAAALAASAASPLVLYFALGNRSAAFVFAVLAALLWLRHSANIGRLMSGAEGKIGAKG